MGLHTTEYLFRSYKLLSRFRKENVVGIKEYTSEYKYRDAEPGVFLWLI